MIVIGWLLAGRNPCEGLKPSQGFFVQTPKIRPASFGDVLLKLLS